MKVSDVAKLTGVTVRTLHYYDEIGLLPPSGVTSSSYRVYNDADLEVLQQIFVDCQVVKGMKLNFRRSAGAAPARSDRTDQRYRCLLK